MRGIRPDKSVKESVAREQIRSKAEAFHFVEDLESELRLLGENVSSYGGIKERFGDGVIGAEEAGVKGMARVIGGDEVEEEGFGVGEFAAGEEGRQESEERFGGNGEGGRCVCLEPFEEGN